MIGPYRTDTFLSCLCGSEGEKGLKAVLSVFLSVTVHRKRVDMKNEMIVS